MPKLRIEEAAAKKQARIDSGKEVIVGVNKYRLDQQDDIDVLSLDNATVRASQLEKLRTIKATRDDKAAMDALGELVKCAENPEGGGNLLALSIACARARATVGEISDALEYVWGRAVVTSDTITGAYAAEYGEDPEMAAAMARVEAFEERAGRRPRVIIGKMGQDGHDRGAKVSPDAPLRDEWDSA